MRAVCGFSAPGVYGAPWFDDAAARRFAARGPDGLTTAYMTAWAVYDAAVARRWGGSGPTPCCRRGGDKSLDATSPTSFGQVRDEHEARTALTAAAVAFMRGEE